MCETESLYNSLKDSGELFDMFPKLKGTWEKDKAFFIKNYEDNQKIINDNYLDLEEDYEGEFCESGDF